MTDVTKILVKCIFSLPVELNDRLIGHAASATWPRYFIPVSRSGYRQKIRHLGPQNFYQLRIREFIVDRDSHTDDTLRSAFSMTKMMSAQRTSSTVTVDTASLFCPAETTSMFPGRGLFAYPQPWSSIEPGDRLL
ncbi:MAG: hypothetical protein P4L92_08390 [Rudaea sp.]|nr:hypothetical protein [Rudaea sp.]